jgi:hypothetical protein
MTAYRTEADLLPDLEKQTLIIRLHHNESEESMGGSFD